MKPTILLALLVSGCSYLAANPPPSARTPGYNLPPCQLAMPNRPCQQPIVTKSDVVFLRCDEHGVCEIRDSNGNRRYDLEMDRGHKL